MAEFGAIFYGGDVTVSAHLMRRHSQHSSARSGPGSSPRLKRLTPASGVSRLAGWRHLPPKVAGICQRSGQLSRLEDSLLADSSKR
jgi:hypothetical protein